MAQELELYAAEVGETELLGLRWHEWEWKYGLAATAHERWHEEEQGEED